MKEIKGFFGQFRFLSNFAESIVDYNDLQFLNSEAAFQAQKTLDINEQRWFTNIPPNEAKSLGRKITLRKDWEEVKEQIMYEVVCSKFSQNETLKYLLLATEDAYLEETNTWHDNTWGCCYCEKCFDKTKKNLLGKILMRVRDEIRNGRIIR